MRRSGLLLKDLHSSCVPKPAVPECSNGGSISSFVVGEQEAGRRLDVCLVDRFVGMSRSGLSKLIRSGLVTVKGQTVKTGYVLRMDDLVEVITKADKSFPKLSPQQVDFSIIYEDESLLVISKPSGLVVHPGAGNEQVTLAHGLLYHCGGLPSNDEMRPGIVHRLDKDTSGVMLVAKTESALRKLTKDFHDRKVGKQYTALLLRCPKREIGRLVAPIGRHLVNRKKMAIREVGGRYAATSWRIIEKFSMGICLAQVTIETGRTHQIRVHMSSIGSPVLGDNLYGGRVLKEMTTMVSRQMLHASTISFTHPKSLEQMTFTVPLCPDMQAVMDYLRR